MLQATSDKDDRSSQHVWRCMQQLHRNHLNPRVEFRQSIYIHGSIISYDSKHVKIGDLPSAGAEYAASAYSFKDYITH